MKILFEFDEQQDINLVGYITANGNDPVRYFKSKLPHPFNKFKNVIFGHECEVKKCE